MVLGIESEILIELIRQYGIIAVMAGALIEEVIVPIPSPIVPMAAGFILIETNLLLPALFQIFIIIAIPASIASVLSSYFVFAIAFYGGEPMVKRYGKYLDLSWEEIQGMERYFGEENEKYLVALFRMLPIVPLSLVSGAAGLFQMNWKEYGIWSFIGMIPRNFFLAFIGWYVRDDFMAFASRIDTFSTWVAIAAVILVGLIVVDRLARKAYRKVLINS